MKLRAENILVIIPVVVVLAALGALYLHTCPRDITWDHNAQDSCDLITSAHILGIPHPTGYPLFTMIGHLFTRIDFKSFSTEHIFWNNSAFKMTLFVVLTSLLNIFLFWRVHILLQRKLKMSIADTLVGSISAGIGALALGTSYLYWSQSIVPEVYILNLLFIDLTLLAILRLVPDGDVSMGPWRWFLLGLIAASGLIHHLSFMMFLPGFFILAIFTFRKPGKRDIILFIIGILLALLPLLYLPIRSAYNPPVDTTNTETWSNFWYHITGKAYRPYLFQRPIGEMFNNLGSFYLKEQFGYTGVILICLGVIGAYLWRSRLSRALLAFCIVSAIFVLFHATNYNVLDRKVFFLPAFFAFAHLSAMGISYVFELTRRLSSRGHKILQVAPIIVLLFGGLWWQVDEVNHAYRWNIDISESISAKNFGSQAFANLRANAIIFTWYDGPSFTLIYYKHVLFEGVRGDVDIVFLPRIQSPWWWQNVEDGHPNIKMTIEYSLDRNAIIEDIIRTNIDKRPIYTSWPQIPIPDDFKMLNVGKLFRIVRIEEYEQILEHHHAEKQMMMRNAPIKSNL